MRGHTIKKELRLDMDLVDVVIKANLFLYAHNTERRDGNLRALYCMHQGIWLFLVVLVLKTLCIFRDKVHQRLRRSRGYPLPLLCLLSDILEILGYISAPNKEEKKFIDSRWIPYARKRGI